jgi:hypothetical protein
VGRSELVRVLSAGGLAIFAIGCFGNEASEFPPGLEPLEETTAPTPDPVDGDPYPEGLSLVRGETPEYHWVHARGFVKAPLQDVYDIMTTPEVAVDERAVARWTVMPDIEPEYERSFQLHNEVDNFITVIFDVNWRFGTVQEENFEPALVAGTFQKVFGTELISLMRGSMAIRRIDGETTEVELMEHISTASGGGDEIEAFIRDYYDEIILVKNGEPLPTYE